MNNNYINELDCEIVEDLIPLYHDKAVSEKTKNAVENHLKGCNSCKAEYGLYLKEVPKCESKSTIEEYIFPGNDVKNSNKLLVKTTKSKTNNT